MPPKAKLHKDNGKRKALPKTAPKNPPQSEPQPSTSEDNQAQFEIELLWCIQQLQTAISSGKLNQKQLQDSTKTLSSLTSNSTPVIRKRQLMRLSFGDYRAKMAEEEAKYARRNERIVYVTSKRSQKSTFVKKAPFLTSGKDFKFNFDTETHSNSETTNKPEAIASALESMDINKPEHILANRFQPSNNAFRFNFSTEME